MKKVILVLAVVLICATADGQRIGLKAGVNFANANFEVMDLNVSLSSRTGVLFGVVSEFQLYDFLYLQPALLFAQKGYDAEFEGMSGFDHFNYLDLPINFLVKADLQGPKLLLYTGPTISYGLNGKTEFENDREDIQFGSGDDKYDRFALGWNVGGGLEFLNLQLTGEYTFGLSDITHLGDVSLKHKAFSISLAYFFGN
ncbi:porin family protein [Mangrovibacterium lignilyticum]|uniref:porin family protein n=1 Tax=Mangrovibacterium lignilyticum TaxID=2668052 RepID=UPI0013D149F4|nr:porin family protein [Mangrovibacterium lignilyticum]